METQTLVWGSASRDAKVLIVKSCHVYRQKGQWEVTGHATSFEMFRVIYERFLYCCVIIIIVALAMERKCKKAVLDSAGPVYD